MLRTFATRFSAGMGLLAQTLLIVAACLCAPGAPGEDAMAAPLPPCHQTEAGLRVSALDLCCCDEDASSPSETTTRMGAASISPTLKSLVPSASKAMSTALMTAPRFSEPARPRPPLRV